MRHGGSALGHCIFNALCSLLVVVTSQLALCVKSFETIPGHYAGRMDERGVTRRFRDVNIAVFDGFNNQCNRKGVPLLRYMIVKATHESSSRLKSSQNVV